MARAAAALLLVVASGAVVGADVGASVGVSETLVVSAANPLGTTSTMSLEAGSVYRITATGTYSYGFNAGGGAGLADPECSTLPPDPTWQRDRYRLLEPFSGGGDQLDLYVDDENVEWEPQNPDPLNCSSVDHTYLLTYEPELTGPVNFRVLDFTGYADNVGVLTVVIAEQSETLIDEVEVPANAPEGATTTIPLDPSLHYRFQVEGTFSYFLNTRQSLADAECSNVYPEPTWLRDRYKALDPESDLLDLTIDGKEVAWTAISEDPLGCDSTGHVYSTFFQPASPGLVRFSINDNYHVDNQGMLRVGVYRLSFSADPTPDPLNSLPRATLAEEITLNGNDADGATSVQPLRAGEQYLIEASGTWAYGAGSADARCSTTTANPLYTPSETNYPPPAFPDGLLRLYLNGNKVDWSATVPDDTQPLCNSTDHTYRLVYIPEAPAQARFTLFDGYFGDNAGALTIKIFLVREIPLGAVAVGSSLETGNVTPPQIPAQVYRYRANGTFSYFDNIPGTTADGECSQAGFAPYNDPSFKRHRDFGGAFEPDRDILDVTINGEHVEWRRPNGANTGCDPDHVYDLTVTAIDPRPSTLVVDDVNHLDNIGVVIVEVFLKLS